MAFTIINALNIFAWILDVLILIRIIVSWLPISKNGVLMRIIYMLTEPILGPIRSLIEKSPLGGPGMMLDFSPIIAGFIIELVKNVLISIVSAVL